MINRIIGYLWDNIKEIINIWKKEVGEINSETACPENDDCGYLEPVDFIEHKDALSDDNVTNSNNTLGEEDRNCLEFGVESCLYDYDEEVRVKAGVEGVATRYYGRKGVVKSILMVGNKYMIGLKIHDRVNLLYVYEDSVSKIKVGF